MRRFFGQKERWQVFKVVGIYAAFSVLWIFLSDSALELFVKDPATIARISIFKGFLFVLVTATLLFHLIARYVISMLEAKQQGQTSEERFRALYDNMYDAVFINDVETGRFIDANQTACSMFGYTREEFLALAISDVSLGMPPYSGEEAQVWLKRALSGQPQIFEWICKGKDGGCFPSEVTLCKTPLGDKDSILAMVRDITERKQAEEALHLQTIELEEEVAERQKAQDELEQLNKCLEQRIAERTAELEEKNTELYKMNRIFVGRELKMVELKERIRELEKAAN